MASTPQPVKKLATVAIVLLLSFLVLQVVGLLCFPSYFTYDYSGYPYEVDLKFYTYFQYIVKYGVDNGGYFDPYTIYQYVGMNIQGMQTYMGILFTAISTFYMLSRRRDLAHLLDKDHARHMLLLAYMLLVVNIIPLMSWYTFYQATYFIGLPPEDSLIYIFFSIVPQLVYIAFALVFVIIFHVAINKVSRGVI
jgi:hypothetical protein